MENDLLEFTQLEKKVLLYVGKATRIFLLNSDSKPTHDELNCLKMHQPGYSGYIESMLDNLNPDITVFPIHDIMGICHMATVVNGSSRMIIILNSYFSKLKRLIGNQFFKTNHIKLSKEFH